MSFHTVARIGDLAPGDVVPVEVEGTQMILYRVGDAYHAAQRRCLHQGADLADALITDDGFLICALHFWRYHADTGVHELSPETCLRTYAVRVEGEAIQVDPTPIWRGEIPS